MTRFIVSGFMMVALAILSLAPRVAQAAESYDNCTGFITSLPAVITTQGTWCLKQNLSTAITSGSAITIGNSNVTLDCNDFKIDGLAAGAGTAAKGIYANNKLNAIVRNCSVRGFYMGLFIGGDSSGGHVIEDNRFDGNTYVGLRVDGDGSVVRRNRVLDTGGSTLSNYVYGIATRYSVDVLDNTVFGVVARGGSGGYAIGVNTELNPDGKIIGNNVRGLFKDGSGHNMAIRNISSGRITLRSNDVAGDASAASFGLYCSTTYGNARDNVISGFATAISSCANSGGNAVIP